jgi:hypothetical protein
LHDGALLTLAIHEEDWNLARSLAEEILLDPDPSALESVAILGFIEHDRELLRRAGYHISGDPRNQTLIAARIMAATYRNKNTDSEMTHLANALASDSYELNGVAAYALGEFYRHRKRFAESSKFLRIAVERLGPQNYEGISKLSISELRQLHVRSALECANIAVNRRPDGQEATRVKFVSLMLLGRPREAMRAFSDWRRAYRKVNPRR